ncbi:MAG TPA: YbaB/EbfC family DNA-binding protein [Paraburkholderia sp.]|jgi:hypothetical protein
MSTGKRNGLSRWLRLVIGVSAIAWSIGGWAQSTGVPQPWVSYAQLVGRQFQAWLEADDDAANQLHAFLEDRILHPKGDAPPSAIVIRAWVGADGAVTTVAFDSLGDPKADAILRSLLTARPITEPPPPDMRQPLRVRLRLEANPDEGQGGAANAS